MRRVPQDRKPVIHTEKTSHSIEKGVDKNPLETTRAAPVENKSADNPGHVAQDATAPQNDLPEKSPEEHGGQAGLEPTRYGDWEKKGRCTDF